MPTNYCGIELNDVGELQDWAPRERNAFEDIIDLLGIPANYPNAGADCPREYDFVLSDGNSVGLSADSNDGRFEFEENGAVDNIYVRDAVLILENEICIANNTYLQFKDAGGTCRDVLGIDGSDILRLQATNATTDVELAISLNGSEVVRVDDVGRVGIGNDDPTAYLDIKLPINQPAFMVRDSANDDLVSALWHDAGGNAYLDLFANGASLAIHFETAGGSYFDSGNVGFGVTSPSHAVHAAGTIAVDTNGAFNLYKSAGATDLRGQFYVDGSGGGSFYLNDDSAVTQVSLQAIGDSYLTGGGLSVGVNSLSNANTHFQVREAELANVDRPRTVLGVDLQPLMEGENTYLQLAGEDATGLCAGIILSAVPLPSGDNKHWIVEQMGQGADNRFCVGYLTSSASDWIPPQGDASLNTAEMLTIETDGRVQLGAPASRTAPPVSALLNLETTTGALLFPRLTTTQRNALTAVNGMMIFNTSLTTMQYYSGGAWVSF